MSKVNELLNFAKGIVEVSMTMENGEKIESLMYERSRDEWDTITPGTRSLMTLINGEQYLVYIHDADEFGDVSFTPLGENPMMLAYQANQIHSLLTELEPGGDE